MVNINTHVISDINGKLAIEPTRDGFGKGLVKAGETNSNVVAVCADLAESTRMHWFKEKFPNRYVEVGVAEQNLATVAAGMAQYGKIPYISSYAAFSPGRNNEQIRTTIALNEVPVKVIGSHAGVSVGPDGATHQALEDVGLMRMIPNMTVIVPCDALEAEKATIAVANTGKPVYIRLARAKSPVLTTQDTPFEIGKGIVMWQTDAPQATIIVMGNLMHNALMAAQELSKQGIEVDVLNIHTIKPLDTDLILKHVQKSKAVVTVEEHQVRGGLGSAVAETLAGNYPAPIEFVGIHDKFGQSGTPAQLYKHYGLDVETIIAKTKKVINRKS